jgi:hypothetical protein
MGLQELFKKDGDDYFVKGIKVSREEFKRQYDEWYRTHAVGSAGRGYVSSNALLKRINRKLLSKRGEAIRKSRWSAKAWENLGRYHRLDVSRKTVIERNVDIEVLGRELKVLAPSESLDPRGRHKNGSCD